MRPEQTNLWEDDEFVYVPEKFFKHLPKEFRDIAEARKQEGESVLQIVDKDIQGLIRLINAIPTTSNLSYIYHRLRTSKIEITREAMMEQEMLTTAFVVSYGRLFASGEGTSGVSRNLIPEHLKSVHDEIIQLRNRRYAHNGSHDSVSSGVNIEFDDEGFQLNMQMTLGLHIGGRDEWSELITSIDLLMHERLTKILNRLEEKTGYQWRVPSGSPPDWVRSCE